MVTMNMGLKGLNLKNEEINSINPGGWSKLGINA
jgi:hypothetical protein